MSIDPTETRPAMDCSELARSAEALLDGEFDERERAEAAAHLAGCEPCRRSVHALERTRTAVREKLRAALGPASPDGRAPAALRARIHQALDRERQPWWRRALAPLPVAAAAACAAGALLVVYTHLGGDPLVDESVSRHTRGLPLEVVTSAMGPDAIPGWFKGKVDFNARPPDLGRAGLHMVGGRISHIQDRPAAYVRYEQPRGHLGLFIVDDPDRRFGSAGRAVQMGGSTVRMVNARGYNVAVWRQNEIVYSLVSDLDEQDLERIVEAALAAPR
jgi:anti-sigma factor RsiW